jgi:pimeloyl-ACP methyl ester carboxylesterase
MDTSGHTQGTAAWLTTRDGRRLFARSLAGTADDSGGSGGTADDRAVTVVFEAGAAAARHGWADVQVRTAALPGVRRAVVYDRSGLGRSPADPDGRTLSRMADDLNDVLDGLSSPGGRPGGGPGTDDRFILVGHSAGGPIVRLAASRRPGRVSGVVTVDATDESQDEMTGPLFRLGEAVVGHTYLALAHLSLMKHLFAGQLATAPADDVRREFADEGFRPQVFRTQIAQARTFMPELTTWRSTPPDLGDIPVTVIAGMLPGDGIPAAARRSAVAAYRARAASYRDGRFVAATRSAHYVPVTDAELVAAEIGRIIHRR